MMNVADRADLPITNRPILVAHCHYQKRGGEDSVFAAETALLENSGHEVIRFELSNEGLDARGFRRNLTLAAQTTWSHVGGSALRALIRKHRPALVHFHNTFPLLSPSAYYTCRTEGVPCVQTLHNYRLLCANAMFLRDGKACEACIGRQFHHAVRYACYRGSRAATAALVAMQYVHHHMGTFNRYVNRYIALTEFSRGKFVEGGLPPERIVVKGNGLANDPGAGPGDGDFVLFVGRLSAEKGLLTLLKAWRSLPHIPLKVAGDGPLFAQLAEECRHLNGRIELLGARSHEEILRLMGAARFLILPSECYEGFPMTVVEAYSRATPVIASKIGSLAEVIEDGVTGFHFPAGDDKALASVVNQRYADRDKFEVLRRSARHCFLKRYAPEPNLKALLKIYQDTFGVFG